MFDDVSNEDDLLAKTRDELRAPFADEIGGGDGYDPTAFGESSRYTSSARITPEDADFNVSTASGLKSALGKLNKADGGGVVWLGTDEIDCTGVDHINVPENVTIASGRGMDDQPTCTLPVAKPQALFHLQSGARATGFEIIGDELEYFDPAERVTEMGINPEELDGAPIYKVGISRAFIIEGDNVEVDNMVCRGFTHAAILINRPQTKAVDANYSSHIHHCEFTDNPAGSLGYGVVVRQGYPIIEYCFFDNNRHSVSGSGWKNCHYVLRYSIVGPVTHSHAIDVHGESQDADIGTDLTKLDRIEDPARVDGAQSAGGRFSVHHNVIMPVSSSGVRIRGVPVHGAQINNNIFFNGREPDTGTCGTVGDGYCVTDKAELTPPEVGLTAKGVFFGLGSPTASLGPPGGAGTPDEELKQRISALQDSLKSREKEIKVLKPKAEAADSIKSGFSKLMGDEQ